MISEALVIFIALLFGIVFLGLSLPWLAPYLERLAELKIFDWYENYIAWVDKMKAGK